MCDPVRSSRIKRGGGALRRGTWYIRRSSGETAGPLAGPAWSALIPEKRSDIWSEGRHYQLVVASEVSWRNQLGREGDSVGLDLCAYMYYLYCMYVSGGVVSSATRFFFFLEGVQVFVKKSAAAVTLLGVGLCVLDGIRLCKMFTIPPMHES